MIYQPWIFIIYYHIVISKRQYWRKDDLEVYSIGRQGKRGRRSPLKLETSIRNYNTDKDLNLNEGDWVQKNTSNSDFF